MTLINPHSEKCVYRKRLMGPKSPWFLTDVGFRESRRRGPGRRSREHFVTLICNDPDCSAELEVKSFELTAHMPTFLEESA